MIFQALDSKEECFGIFADGRLIFDNQPENLSATWKYSPSVFSQKEIEYAYVLSSGATLSEMCPEFLEEEWSAAESKMKAFFRSFSCAKVSLDENCFFDMVPNKFLHDYYSLRNEITRHTLQTCKKQKNYNFLASVHEMIETIASQKLNIDSNALNKKMHQIKTRSFSQKLVKISPFVRYNMFGSKTGRLTNVKRTFPILTMDKEHRCVIKPKNDLFVELDYNGAEIRTLLALSGKEQPAGDIHQWNVDNLTSGNTSRHEMKERFFAWLYNPSARDEAIEKHYDRNVSDDFWDGDIVSTPYGREIPADKHHSLNYLIQSTTNDLVLENALKIFDYLSDKETNIAFTVHDSVVLDFKASEFKSLLPIVEMFENTRFGNFKANVSAGKDYGNLKEIACKR